MLKIVVPQSELWNSKTQEFEYIKECTLHLEHSLLSISKWESKFEKPFLSKSERTPDEIMEYVKCMTVNTISDPRVYDNLSEQNVQDITNYINAKMTATTFKDEPGKSKHSNEVITSELIYYWMVASNIPLECERWHLNRLLTLIRICGVKNKPPKKMSKRDAMKQNSSLNAARRARMGTHG